MSNDTLIDLHGRMNQISVQRKNMFSHAKEMTMPAVDASITVGAEGATTNQRTITIQLKQADGSDIDYAETVELIMFGSSAKTAFATTGGSTGIAAGTDGALLTVVAKKLFLATSEADGDIDVTYTDTATAETVALGVRLPTGKVITSSSFANA